jgi:hypothetical protein
LLGIIWARVNQRFGFIAQIGVLEVRMVRGQEKSAGVYELINGEYKSVWLEMVGYDLG